ncbi:UNVERIFIED_CONTAM: hypothetical protein NCL1_56315 [Trichonephila clavipes]
MSEKALVDHIFVRLEPQIQDYVEVRDLQNTVQLLEVLAKFEERYSCKAIRGSRNSDNLERRGWNERRMSNGSEHGDQKRPTPESTQGIKRIVPSSISSRNYKYRRPNNLSQRSQSIAGPSHQIDIRQCKPPTEGSRQGVSVQYDKARETRTTPSGGNSTAERRPVRSRQATASGVKPPEGIPEEQKSNGIDSIPQKNLRRMSLSMEA